MRPGSLVGNRRYIIHFIPFVFQVKNRSVRDFAECSICFVRPQEPRRVPSDIYRYRAILYMLPIHPGALYAGGK